MKLSYLGLNKIKETCIGETIERYI